MAKERNGESSRGSALRFVGVGFELVVPLLVGVFGGYKLDQWLGTEPWLVIVGSVLGMAAGFLNFFRAVLPRKGSRTGDGNGS